MLQISDAQFSSKVLKSKKLVLVMFSAPWCSVCKPVTKMLESLETDASICKIDIESDPLMAQEYEIKSLPTIVLFKGGEAIDQVSGNVSSDKLLKIINDA
jgi:thioredoxin 1